MTEPLRISWEESDEDVEGAFVSACGRFKTSLDPVYGYLKLHRAGEFTESLGESMTLADLTRMAENLVAREIACPVAVETF
ncbi:hypothetical protein LAZ40_11130 [Cereibacter sphaeroides]|uniref:hypothetical protein n=1 Tax=Cereibacter sphaeroides TaxID=1063 RepID=UPI001F242CE1|nr:hypothetical protein [Cereibacter sphaeroides]MCE6959608.1 hypothetical protein [Cereibacter sphaeroides]MCE6974532.1 hypothetical protein [Cereibacter sphaeroides]